MNSISGRKGDDPFFAVGKVLFLGGGAEGDTAEQGIKDPRGGGKFLEDPGSPRVWEKKEKIVEVGN